MSRSRAYGIVCGTLGVAFVLLGLVLFAGFFAYHAPDAEPALPTGPVGYYFAAFAGCALVGWGGALLAAARHPVLSRPIGTATAFALALCAVYRIAAWFVGDYSVFAGNILRAEAVFFLVVALLFVWLRPAATATAAEEA